MPDRTDLLLLGATGFTGRLIARYLSQHPEYTSGAFSFSIAGRSASKLRQIQEELDIDSERVKIIEVDIGNEESINEAVKTTRVVINAVGPFWKWARPVVRACAKAGVHHLDLTGETHYMSWTLENCHSIAQETKSIIIPSSAHDSIPSDLSVYLSNRTLKAFNPKANIAESTSAFEMKGGVSGGTLSTVIVAMEEVPSELRKSSNKNFAYSPVKGVRQPTTQLTYALPLYPHIAGGFYFMFPCDRQVVQRTWGLHQELNASNKDTNTDLLAYGPNFRYSELLVTGGRLSGMLMSIALGLVMIALTFSPLRWLFKKLATQPGFGPSENDMQKGSIVVTNVSTSEPDPTTGKVTHVRSILKGRGDPGYLLTSIMISEAALAIALEKNALPHLAHQGGVLTPMSALGDILIRRLERSGRYEFKSEVVDDQGQPISQ